MLNKTFEVRLNTKFQGSQRSDIIVNQGDTRSVIFNFRVYDGVNEIDYADVDETFLLILKPDRNVVQLSTQPRSPSGYTVTLNQNALAVPGRVTSGLALYGHDKERITTLFFDFLVGSDLIPADVVASSTEFDALSKAIIILNWMIEQKENFPRLPVLGGFDSFDELISTFPDGSSLNGGFFVDISGETHYFYWDIIQGIWRDAGTIKTGPRGDKGEAATIDVGSVQTSAPGGSASVSNTGDSHNAVFDFVIPQGETGPRGIPGEIVEDDLIPIRQDINRLSATINNRMPIAPDNVSVFGIIRDGPESHRLTALEGTEVRSVVMVSEHVNFTVTDTPFALSDTRVINIPDDEFERFEVFYLTVNGATARIEKEPMKQTVFGVGNMMLYRFEYDGDNRKITVRNTGIAGSNPNILHNWDFRNPINQRGLLEYTGGNIYTIDRWLKIGTNSVITVGDGFITLTSGGIGQQRIRQLIEFPQRYAGLEVTLSAIVRNRSDETANMHIGWTDSTVVSDPIPPNSDWNLYKLTATITNDINLLGFLLVQIGGVNVPNSAACKAAC